MKMLVAVLMFLGSSAYAGGGYQIGEQETVITGQTSALNVKSTSTIITNGAGASAVNIQDGGNNISIDDGGNNISIDDGGNSITVDTSGGAIDVQGTLQVTGSTMVVAGAGGTPVDVIPVLGGGTTALATVDLSKPNLDGKVYQYERCEGLAAAGSCSITGLGYELTLEAIGGQCVWTFKGKTITMSRSGRTISMEYLQTNPSVTLTSKDASATCNAELSAAN